MLAKLKIRHKLWLLILSTMIVICAVTVFAIKIPTSFLIQERQTRVHDVVELGYSIVNHYAQQAASGAMDTATAQQEAKLVIAKLRFDGDNYFSIYDTQNHMVMHPIKPEMIGKDLSSLKDTNGVLIVTELVKAAQKNQTHFLTYQWPKPGSKTPIEKTATSKLFAPWGWVLAVGIYTDDVEITLNKYANKLMFGIAVGLLLLLIGAFFITRSITRPLHALNTAITQADQFETLAPRLEANDSAEINRIYRTFAELFARLRLREQENERTLRDKFDAENANNAKSDFLANMSHEIRTPMNAVIGLAHLAQQKETNPKQLDYLIKIQHAAESLLQIINDILDFTKIEANKLTFEECTFDLDEVLANVAIVTSQKAGEKNIDYVFNIANNIPKQLQGDPLRLGQVLTNLLNNAIKFTETNGEVELSCKVVQQDQHAITLDFRVQDTGIGITQEQLTKLFTPFHQADNSITRKYGGTGLGLSISVRLLALMGSKIQVESLLGRGSSFQFELKLPYHTLENDKPKHLQPSASQVLIIDAHHKTAQILFSALQQFPFEVEHASSVLTALQLQPAQPFNLIFCDELQLENHHSEMAQLIQVHSNAKLITLSTSNSIHLNASEAEFKRDGLLSKPFTPTALHQLIDDILVNGNCHPISTETRHITQHFNGERILLTEDNPINQQISIELLEMVDLTVELANNGQEAVQMVLSKPVDYYALVLMDLQMPIMDGHSATQEIRRATQYHSLPIIAMTAHAMSTIRERCIQDGMQDFVSKPIQPESLFKILSYWLKQANISASTPTIIQQYDWQQLKTMNTTLGLSYMGNKESMYLRLLQHFSASYSNAQQQLEAYLAAQQVAEAERLIHSLKGLAGSMGATHLQDIAEHLEHALHQQLNGVSDEPLSTHIAEFSAALQPTLIDIADFLRSLQSAPVVTTA